MKLRVACVVVGLLSLALSLVQLTVAQTTAETPSVANAAVAPSGVAPALSGGGTKDYVPLWLNSTKLGNSKLFQSGAGRIGVGTTTPAATLDVNGAVNAATSFNLGRKLFAFGSYVNQNAFLGFAGNSTTTGTGNTASGYATLFANTTGYANTATGLAALANNTTGELNTAIGYAALTNNISGLYNTALGYSAGYNVSTGSNNIDIRNEGTISDNGTIRIGTTGTQTSAFIAGIYGAATSVNNAVPVLIDSNGNLGTISSSRRYKEDIQDMGDASRDLMRLRPVTFRYKKPFDDGSQPMQYGLIAEEVAEVYPDLVAHSSEGQIETVKYQLLDPMLLNEVQRQQTEIRELQERLSKMEAALAAVYRAPEGR